jgi:photosystem II stability/assembly factor-like uncharacterized protein
MTEFTSVFAATGSGVVRFTFTGGKETEAESLLDGVGARCVAIDPREPHRVYVGTFDRGVYVSEDGGTAWRKEGQGLHDQRVMSVAVSPSHQVAGISVAYAGTEPSNVYRSEDAGHSWQRLPALLELPSQPRWSFPPRPWTHHVRTIAPHPYDPNWLAVGIELGGVMRSDDGGASWLDHNPEAHSDAHHLLTHARAPQRLYEVAGQGIARSDDLGQRWRRVTDGLDRFYAWAQALDPADPDLWYVAVSRSPFAAHGPGDGQARLFRSRGDGFVAIDNWGDAPRLRRMPYALVTRSDQPGWLLVGLRGGVLLVTEDAGESWKQLSLELPDVIDLAVANR